MATLSAGVLREGQHAAMIGTSMCWGFIHAGAPASPGLISMPYVLDDREMTYTFGGAATAGAVIRWFRDTLGDSEVARAAAGGPSAYELLAGEAEKIAAGSEGLIALPYFMGERSPIWDVNARGTVTGLTLSHSKAHLYRAMLEGVSYALEHNIEFAIAGNPHLDEALTVVGGAAKSELWLDIIASVTGRPVRASAEAGEAAYGDAMLAAQGIGLIGKGDLPVWTEKNLPNRYRDPATGRPRGLSRALPGLSRALRRAPPLFRGAGPRRRLKSRACSASPSSPSPSTPSAATRAGRRNGARPSRSRPTTSSSSAPAAMASPPPTTSPRSTASRNVAVLEKGWLGGGNTGRNTTIIRSNYLWDESAALYEHALKLWEDLSQELNYNVMYSPRGVMMLAHNVHDIQVLQAPHPCQPAERHRQ